MIYDSEGTLAISYELIPSILPLDSACRSILHIQTSLQFDLEEVSCISQQPSLFGRRASRRFLRHMAPNCEVNASYPSN